VGCGVIFKQMVYLKKHFSGHTVMCFVKVVVTGPIVMMMMMMVMMMMMIATVGSHGGVGLVSGMSWVIAARRKVT
jgi:hypothetical protein